MLYFAIGYAFYTEVTAELQVSETVIWLTSNQVAG